jgi:FkbM family methyltransferase
MQNKPNSIQETAPFGKHAPGRNTLLLRAITKIGVSRGKINRWIGRKWQNLGYTLVDKTVRGINYRLHITKNTTDSKLLSTSKIYDKTEIQQLSHPLSLSNEGKDKVFVDVGANTGYYSLTMAKLGYDRVIAIEPNPLALEILSYNVAINTFGKKITIVPKCISENKQTPFYCSGGLGDASVIAQSHETQPIMVDSDSLLNILHEAEISHIDAMTIDIEGYEDRALKPFFDNAPSTLHPNTIVIEVCHEKLWQSNILQILEKHNYTLIKTTRANKIYVRHCSA